MGGIPNCKVVKMPFHQYVELDPAAGLTAQHTFRPNSIYDPDYTGTGHQPRGHDEWSLMYTKYEVYRCEMKATFHNESAIDRYIIAIEIDDDTLYESSVEGVMENQQNKRLSILRPLGNPGSTMTLKKTWTQRKFLCNGKMRDPDLDIAAFGANPLRSPVPQFRILCRPFNNSKDLQTLPCTVELVYYCRLYDRKELPQS